MVACATVQLILNHCRKRHVQNNNTHLALIQACFAGQAKVVELLGRGALVNTQRYDGVSALIMASFAGHFDIVKFLIDRGARVNMQDDQGRSALFMASLAGHAEIARLLLDNGTQVNTQNNHGSTTLLVACLTGSAYIVAELLQQLNIQPMTNSYFLSVIRSSVKGHIELVKLLLDRGADVNIKAHGGISPLVGGCFTGCIETVKLLLLYGVDLNAKAGKVTALDYASLLGHTEIVQVLLVSGVQVEATYALLLATSAGHIDIMKILLDHGADLHMRGEDGRTPLHMASITGCKEALNLIFDSSLGDDRKNSLIKSSLKGHDEAVQLLLKYGAQVNKPSCSGQSALCTTCLVGDTKTAQVLLEHGAQVNGTDGDIISALMIACLGGHTETVQVLLDHGANINIQGSNGIFPLMLASLIGDAEIAHHLFAEGDKNVR